MKNYPVCDLHCDTILGLRNRREKGLDVHLDQSDRRVSVDNMKKGNVCVQTFALFTSRVGKRSPEHEALSLLNRFQKELERNKDSLVQVVDRQSLNIAKTTDKIGALLSLEEGDVMFQDLNLLDFWYRMGVRMIALTWNYPNAISWPNINFEDDSTGDYHVPSPIFRLEKEKGLTDHGKAYVKKCEELGILVDVSHLGDKGFWDVIEIAEKPVIASHSNCRAVCEVSRNLDDDMIRAIAKTGGVIGLNFCADFLKENTDDVSHLEDMVRHLNHLKAIGGIDVCAIGTDFDGIHSKTDVADSSEFAKLAQALEEDGWSEEEIEKAMGGNFLRLLETILPEKL